MDKNDNTIKQIICYLRDKYQIDINDSRTLLEIIIEKFRNKQITKVNDIWVF